jgi:phage terminase Nu1 subunit (DNA packaging protein)
MHNLRGDRATAPPVQLQELNSGVEMPPVNAATLALVLGISRAGVSRLNVEGVLPRAGKGLFDLPGCVQAYLKHKVAVTMAGAGATQSLVAERSRLTKIKADAAEVEARKLAGELVPAADIEAAWLAVAGTVRTRLLLIPAKTAPRIVALKTPAEAQALLRKEINAALAAIAATPAI